MTTPSSPAECYSPGKGPTVRPDSFLCPDFGLKLLEILHSEVCFANKNQDLHVNSLTVFGFNYTEQKEESHQSACAGGHLTNISFWHSEEPCATPRTQKYPTATTGPKTTTCLASELLSLKRFSRMVSPSLCLTICFLIAQSILQTANLLANPRSVDCQRSKVVQLFPLTNSPEDLHSLLTHR